MAGNNLKYADEFAADYDNSILKNNWTGPEVIFELTTGLIEPQSKILDLGIGTGESSRRFQNAGHLITGLDGSEKMLDECRKKKIASELIVHNIEEFPFPLENKQYDAVISNGVFHLIHPLSSVFSEVKRILNPMRYFVFTYENANDISESIEIDKGIWERKTESGVYTYKYTDVLISDLLFANNFEIICQNRFLAFTNKQLQKDIFFNATVAQLQQNR